MKPIIVTAAVTLPITVEQARTQCHAPENGDDDVRVESALRTAVEYVEQETGLVLQPTTLEYRSNRWPAWSRGFCRGYLLALPSKPVRDIVAVEYVDTDGVVQGVAEANYVLDISAMDAGGVVRFKNDYSFPPLSTDDGYPVRVIFDAGYDTPGASGSGDDPNLVLPEMAIAAVKLKTELGYDLGTFSDVAIKQMDAALASLIAKLKVYR